MWASGIFALAGVIIGGLLNGAVTALLERRREARAVRASSRLLLEPLRSARQELDFALNIQRWWPIRHGDLGDMKARWHSHRDLLASHDVPLNDWDALAGVFAQIEGIYVEAARVVDAGESASTDRSEIELPPFWAAALRNTRDQIDRVVPVLERLAS